MNIASLNYNTIKDLGVLENYKAFKLNDKYSSTDWINILENLSNDKSIQDIYDIYQARHQMLIELTSKLSKDKSNEGIKQSILELGWNPELEYTSVNRNLLAKHFKESLNNNYISEAKEFPIQFDAEGNLLIKNARKLDYNTEYNKSNKLLKIYDKSDNIEGMKYELAKLWWMNSLLDKIRHEKRLSREDLKSLDDSRSRINDTFQKYLIRVQELEPSFNFQEYYDNTPFNDSSYKFNASTLKYSKDFIKSILF